ncbi:MAG TPA: ShlB/FhaC/HecB family hemolysin secretion/activation protein [Sphingomicrobium sp.]|nr:ShlB/FhaC/HecB family hemolysin secretion/activation protein [Sphingomicrobium sp.]
MRSPLQRYRASSRQALVHLAGATALLGNPATSFAQSPPRPVAPPTREEVTRPTTPPPAARSRLEVEGGIERAPCALEGPEFRSIHFVLRGAEFEGLQGLTRADLAPAYAGFIGREVPVATVCEVRDSAATILRDSGYIAAVQVPEQRIADGIIHFQVLMAHLTQIRVRGEVTGAETVLGAYFNQLTKRPLFNRFEAERYLLLASDLPGYTVRLTLRPAGTAPGDVVGDVTVQRLPAYVDLIVQNGGSHELGPWGGLVRAQFFGLTGLGDRTILSLFTTADFHEQQTVQLGHEMRIGPEGLSLSSTFTYAWARPSVPQAHVLAKTLLATFELGYPFIRRQETTLRGSVGMDIVNEDVWLDRAALTRDRLRVAFMRLGIDALPPDNAAQFTTAEPPWHLTGLVELRQGLNALGATQNCGPAGINCLAPGDTPPSRLEGRSDATVLRFTGYGELRPIPKLTVALGARAQYAWQPLFSFEDFSAGNYTVGRGYDPGVLLGDRGFGTQLELRYGSRIPVSVKRPAVEGYAFWDHSNVGHRDSAIILTSREHLDSVGGGARVNWDRFALDAALAIPLTHLGPLDRKPPVRILVSLTSRLWPWKY